MQDSAAAARKANPLPRHCQPIEPMTKTLTIPYLAGLVYEAPLRAFDAALNKVRPAAIREAPWAEFPYVPDVSVSIGHFAGGIAMRYRISEEVAQARYRQTHDPVHKDSCVEFFVSFDDGAHYYNLEINCLGTRMMAYGDSVVSQRSVLPTDIVETIRIRSSIDTGKPLTGQGQWELLAVIPLSAFVQHPDLSLPSVAVRGNFYKCGDDLPVPHFVAWNRVEHPTPSFHQPACFGNLLFVKP